MAGDDKTLKGCLPKRCSGYKRLDQRKTRHSADVLREVADVGGEREELLAAGRLIEHKPKKLDQFGGPGRRGHRRQAVRLARL